MVKDELLKLRSDVAKSNHGATYLIFNDREMEELVKIKPKSIEELGKIKGFPINGKRVQAYGNRLVSIFVGKKTTSKTPKQNLKSSNAF